jgi:8-oxo-dGTP pyrophosphatase MutT (NUDIX family)
MPIRGSPNGAYHPHPQAGRDRPEWVVAINRNAWSQSIGIAGRDHPVRATGSFLDCIVREIQEEIGYYLAPERFEPIFRRFGNAESGGAFHNEFFLARDVPVERLTVTEGSLKIVSIGELEHLQDALTPVTQRALKIFAEREASLRR